MGTVHILLSPRPRKVPLGASTRRLDLRLLTEPREVSSLLCPKKEDGLSQEIQVLHSEGILTLYPYKPKCPVFFGKPLTTLRGWWS